MSNAMVMGMNRTGIGTSPSRCQEAIEGAKEGLPTSGGDESEAAALRVAYSQDAPPVGTVPPLNTLKGVAKKDAQVITGEKGGVLVDLLGERLAFERTGVRLYEALMSKFRAGGTWRGGPSMQDLREIHDEELRHFELLRKVFARFGADATATVPSADLAGVEAMGVLQTLTDPRVSPAQGLHAILTAELTDHDGWHLLIELVDKLGEGELGDELRVALINEERHVNLVRGWLKSYVLGEERLELDEMPT